MEKSSLNFARSKIIIIFAAHSILRWRNLFKWRDGLLDLRKSVL